MAKEVSMIGSRIRETRREANLTQEQLAQKIGISTVTLNRYEKGHRSPDADFLNQLVISVRCDPMWILTGQKEAWCTEGSAPTQKEQPKKFDPALQSIINILENDLPEDIEHILKILLARVQLKEGLTALARYPRINE